MEAAPRKRLCIVVRRVDGTTDPSPRCTRTLCKDGTLMEMVYPPEPDMSDEALDKWVDTFPIQRA
jgi:hypothetical protein